ncbi:MAG: hypothetical protein ACK5GP_01015 [bacterium]|jgi:hypothetical protein
MEIASLKIKPIATETSLRMLDQKADKSYHFGNFCLILQTERNEGDCKEGFEGFLVEASCS